MKGSCYQLAGVQPLAFGLWEETQISIRIFCNDLAFGGLSFQNMRVWRWMLVVFWGFWYIYICLLPFQAIPRDVCYVNIVWQAFVWHWAKTNCIHQEGEGEKDIKPASNLSSELFCWNRKLFFWSGILEFLSSKLLVTNHLCFKHR